MSLFWSLAIAGSVGWSVPLPIAPHDARAADPFCAPTRPSALAVPDSGTAWFLTVLPASTRDVIARVRATAPSLLTLHAALRAAQAAHAAAGGRSPLTLSVNTEEMPGAQLDRAGMLEAGVDAPLWRGARRRAARAVAAVDVDAAKARLAAGELRLAVQVAEAIETMVAWAAIAERGRDERRVLTQLEQTVTDQFSVGDARYADVLRLRTEQLRVMTDLADAEHASRAARLTILGMAGGDGAVRATLDTTLTQIATERLRAERDTASTAIAAWRWDVLPDPSQAAAASYATRYAEVQRTRSRAEATLRATERATAVSGTVGLQRFGEAGGVKRTGLALGLSMTLPFSAQGTNQRTAAADAERVGVADAVARAALVAVRANLEIAAERYRAARARWQLYDTALLRGARDEREHAIAAYQSGSMTLLEVLDFERALVHAESRRLTARLDAVRAYAAFVSLLTTAPDTDVLLSAGSLSSSSDE